MITTATEIIPDLKVTETGQKAYLVLSEEERSKGFLERKRVLHTFTCWRKRHEIEPTDMSKHGRTGNACGVATKMGTALTETYARESQSFMELLIVWL